ncbi:MAG: major capsid protein [Stappiaceae bacterium]
MATLSVKNPTLMDLATAMDPNGNVADVVEILSEENEILEDMTWLEGNLPTGHTGTVRTGIPEPTWRKMYGGVQPNKSSYAKITDNCGMLEAYAEVDKALADLNGNSQAFRLQEDRAHIEGLNQEIAETLFLGNEATEPESFTGFAPRFNTLSGANNSENVIDGGAAGGQTDCASIWLIVWSPQTVHGIVPKGSKAGLQMHDLGEVTIENVDGNGGRMQAYRTHYRWDAGLHVRDWRYVVRIANIDRSTLTKDASAGADLIDLMTSAEERLPNIRMGRPAWYMDRDIRAWLRKQRTNKTLNATITEDKVAGRRVVAFNDIPVRRVDKLSADEARIS